MRHFFYIKIALIPILGASHSISKVFINSGNDNNEAKINFSFNKLNAFSCYLIHLNHIDFLTISIKGVTRVLKPLTNIQ
jgi:hypothetical protein